MGQGPDHTGLIHCARGTGCCFERIWKLYAGQWLSWFAFGVALPSHRLEDGSRGRSGIGGPARRLLPGPQWEVMVWVREREARLLCALKVELTGFAESWKGG